VFARALAFLDKLSPAALITALFALISIVGFVNYLSGVDTTFSAIYLFPISIAAWYLGRQVALGFCFLSSFYWVGGDILAGAHYATVWIPIWNTGVRFAVFVCAVYLIVEFRELHKGLENRARERAAKLTAEIAAREQLERELLSISEHEQRRLGQDIHDSLCQHLTGTAFASQVLAQKLKSQGSAQAPNAVRVVELIEDGITLSRNLARGLTSVRLSTDGLMEALEDFAASTSDLFKISCRFECPLPVLVEDPETAEHLYRIAQEAVGNAIKHGHAKNIVIQLEVSESGILLSVLDDGTGLQPDPTNGEGMGLRIMSYRAQVIGAKFNIGRRESMGTAVTCLLPQQEAMQ
jgi:signal transduction histidine kinase